MAVKTSKWLLLKMLFLGKFTEPFAVRLMGTAGERRTATEEEVSLFLKRVAPYRLFKGHDLLWGNLRHVRDITFDSIEPVHVGRLAGGSWK